ncbi:putative molybdenum carrier protein [Corynebacterium nuruki]|uniref:putative molybdenum carrier protein n=1 Tax=Corynebacterium nuruki TaxID=1032851 RepID=UPI0039BF6D4B
MNSRSRDGSHNTARTFPLITAVRSGGQTGVDRGALDAASESGMPVTGWCPAGGWAEDLPDAPGLLTDYPELTETPSTDPAWRTEWNVRDSHVTLVITPGSSGPDASRSPGTDLTVALAEAYGRPVMTVSASQDVHITFRWLFRQGRGLTVNIAGPRESECPGAYAFTRTFVAALLNTCGDRQ